MERPTDPTRLQSEGDPEKMGYVPDENDPEIAALSAPARKEGTSEELLKAVAGACESREEHLADLRTLAEPRGKRIIPGELPPLPPYHRELEAYEEVIFLETLAGEHEPRYVVGGNEE